MASDLPQPKRVRLHAKRFCDHCNCFVSKSTWYNHRDVSNHTDAGACSHSLEVSYSLVHCDVHVGDVWRSSNTRVSFFTLDPHPTLLLPLASAGRIQFW